jgi:hypothetical protein
VQFPDVFYQLPAADEVTAMQKCKNSGDFAFSVLLTEGDTEHFELMKA